MSLSMLLLRSAVNKLHLRTIVGCNKTLLTSTFHQNKRFQHDSEGENFMQIQGAKIKYNSNLGLLQPDVKNTDPSRILCIRFEKLKQEEVVVRYGQRIKQIIHGKKDEPDHKIKMEDLTNIVLEAAKDICGTSEKEIYKCYKCDNVFSRKGHLVTHLKGLCTGIRFGDSRYRKCDKCLKDIEKKKFLNHYRLCQGVKEVNTAKTNCPDCGRKMKKSSLISHQKNCKGKHLLKCTDCGEVFGGKGNLVQHMKACTGSKSDDPSKRKCDKCLKEYDRTYLQIHYKICQGVIKTKSEKVKCPDCGKEMVKTSLRAHRRFYCQAGQSTPDEKMKEVDELTNIIMKVAKDVCLTEEKIVDNAWLQGAEEEIQGLRSNVSRVLRVTGSVSVLGDKGVCSDCGLEMSKKYIKKHQKLYCTARFRGN